jgi:hypothetical protein
MIPYFKCRVMPCKPRVAVKVQGVLHSWQARKALLNVINKGKLDFFEGKRRVRRVLSLDRLHFKNGNALYTVGTLNLSRWVKPFISHICIGHTVF